MMKSNKGITLVALVITIIVLLILAGVSISLVVGDNGIMTRAKDAGEKTNAADALSSFELAVSGLTAEYYQNAYVGSGVGTNKVIDHVATNINTELNNLGYSLDPSTGTMAKTGSDVEIKVKKKDAADGTGIAITYDVTTDGNISDIKLKN